MLPDQLRLSLERTLSWYPQCVGQLHWATRNSGGDHTQRVGRLLLTYGTSNDPGVEFVVANSPVAIDAFLPSASERLEGGFWDATQLSSGAFLPPNPLPLHDLEEHTGLPGLMIQATTFACGGIAIAVKFAHPLADAQTLARFMHDWAATNRAMVHALELPVLQPVFEPQRLDRAAAGDIDVAHADSGLLEKSRVLPRHRYDWWATNDGSVPSVPAPLKAATEVSAADPMPWSEWNMQAPVSHDIIHFTPDEIQHMWEAAQGGAPVSRHDALLAHVWALVNRARGLVEDDQPVHMNITLGLRGRVSPPLPDNFLGSPIILGRLSMSGRESSSGSLSEVAARIRSTVNLFDAESIAALLHDMAHDLALVRLWHAFLGERNLIVTSWVHLRLYEVDFGPKTCARYVEAIMPRLDGCLQVMEAFPAGRADVGYNKAGRQKRWYDDGVDVSLHLTTDAMEKLVKDPLLRRYSVPSDN
ncbi:transferase family protein [Daedalea quercina L-15889]|uniref:Transferase family protein n=1 Tax=Daedalea quercina L-15889 TaxID=1314783 RepID=A0A165TVD4_9APHY|nr:transferase family protein [Daedalea quercina L-15889]